MIKARCTASPILWVIFCTISTLLLGLSYWQMSKGFHRLSEEAAQSKLAHTQNSVYTLEQSYQHWLHYPVSIQDSKVLIEGQLHQSTLLLHDNRILDGKAGYGVYGLIQLPSSIGVAPHQYTHILIQIGWHPIPQFDRNIMPQLTLMSDINSQAKNIHTQATLEHIFPDVFTLNNEPPEMITQNSHATNSITTLLRMQTIDFKAIDHALNTKLLPFVARATDSFSIPHLRLNTQPITKRGISAEKNFGYSVQWFIFWCIALGVFIYTQCSCYHLPQSTQPNED